MSETPTQPQRTEAAIPESYPGPTSGNLIVDSLPAPHPDELAPSAVAATVVRAAATAALPGQAEARQGTAPERQVLDKPLVQEPDLPMVWPHTVGAAVELATRVAVRGARSKVRKPFSDHSESSRALLMRKINGAGSEVLADKYPFIELMGRLGYHVPRQVQVSGSEPLQQKLARTAAVFPEDGEQLICKPPQGSNGKGIVEVPKSGLSDLLAASDEDYIVQERVQHQLEVRYVRALDKGSGQIQRVYLEKEIPKLKGNGSQTKRQLLAASGLPLKNKIATRFQNRGSLDEVVPEGGSIHLATIGGIPSETPEWGPSYEQRVKNMDRFMKQMLTDIQTEIGHELPVLCFDIGFRDASVLDAADDEYDFEKLKASAVPFECQMPFTMARYVAQSRRNPGGMPETILD